MEATASAANRPQSVSLLFVLFSMFILSACSTPQTQITGLDYDDSALLESYRQVLVDDGIPLTDVEMRALISTAEIDRNLTPEQLREVQIYFKYYVHSGRGVIERFLQRSEPYIGYTTGVFAERGMPAELANLAFIESGYNPLAISRASAVGMWQFMPSTGKHYGLTQDWYMDERRDPYRSTQAAAEYLQKLYGDFGDWHLAVAAYNAGEGKIGRALAGTGTDCFFDLCDKNYVLSDRDQLRDETMQFVPRFLAMCKIMRNADALGFKAAEPPADKPRIIAATPLVAKPGTDLAALASHLGMTWQEFSAYNPAFLRYMTPADRHVNIYVPYHLEAKADQALRDETLIAVGNAAYTVVGGDTLGKIGTRFGVSVAALRQANPNSEPLQIGRVLTIPGVSSQHIITASAPDPAPSRAAGQPPAVSGGTYTVVAGDTLSQIAERYGVPLSTLRAANPNSDPLRVGAKLTIPGGGPAPVLTAAVPATYTVVSGDTLGRLAERFGVSLSSLRAANPNSDPLRVGAVLTIPGGGSAPAPSAPAVPATYTVAAGDTLSQLAMRFGVSLADMRAANPNSDPLKVGAVLQIPRGGSSGTTTAAAPSAPQLSRETQLVRHTVQAGETLASIARKYSVALGEVQAANSNISNFNNIRVGQQISVPMAVEVYKVQSGDTMSGIAQRFNVSTSELLSLNNMNNSSVIRVGDSIRVAKI